jgi:hypothetical protein
VLVREAVGELVRIALRHERYLRAVVLVSGVHPEVQRRGGRYAQELGDLFADVVLRARDVITHADAERAVRSCFGSVFSASIIRLACGRRSPRRRRWTTTHSSQTSGRQLSATSSGQPSCDVLDSERQRTGRAIPAKAQHRGRAVLEGRPSIAACKRR